MAYILHIDTSTDKAVYFLANNGGVMGTTYSTESRDHASSINLLIEQLLHDAEITFRDLSGIAVCAGPGSYTGLRIGMATAKGYCFGLDIPLVLHNKLILMGLGNLSQQGELFPHYISVLYARENEYFVSVTNVDGTVSVAPLHMPVSSLDVLLNSLPGGCIVTDKITEYLERHTDKFYVRQEATIDADIWANASFNDVKCKNCVNLSTAEPFYLKQVYTHK